jgi:hypothetical protein
MTSDNRKMKLLRDLFKATRAESQGVSRRGFLAKHPNDIEEVERLIAAGEIQYRDDKNLRLPLLGLIELAHVMPEVESVRYLCSHLFDVLRTAFIDHPDGKLSVPEIAVLADMPDRRVAVAFGFLLDAPIFESWSTSPSGFHADIMLSDRILKYQAFDDLVDAMRAQRRKMETSGVTEKPGDEKGTAGQGMSSAHSYVDPARLSELRSVVSKKWDLTRLVRVCEELNGAFERDAFITCSMLVRSIVDHVPPIFGCKSFSELANNYAGSKSFRGSMQHLDKSLRNHADGNLHTQIRRKESLPTRTQVAFWSDLDKLLEETIRLLEDDRTIKKEVTGDSDAGH